MLGPGVNHPLMVKRTRKLSTLLLAGLLCMLGAGQAAAQREPEEGTPQAPALGTQADDPREIPGVSYQVEFVGNLSDEVRAQLDAISRLQSETDRPPLTEAALRRRVREDEKRLTDALIALGYYSAKIESEIIKGDPVSTVELRIETGPAFTLSDYTLVYEPPSPAGQVPESAEDLGLRIGMKAATEPLLRAETQVLRRLAETGYPKAKIAEKKYVADRRDNTLSGRLEIDTGARATFGALTIEGLESVEEPYIRRIVEWPRGEIFDQRKLDAIRNRLARANLFRSILIEPAEDIGPTGMLPVTLRLEESKHRSIGAGASFTSGDVGFGGEVFWEHRNLLGEGERLRIQGTANELRQEAAARARKPNFLRIDQSLLGNTALAHEDSDAFKEKSWTNFVGLERQLTEHLTVSAGPAFEISEIDDGKGDDNFRLIGVLGAARFDNRDDKLNPTKGLFMGADSRPWRSTVGKNTTFWKNEFTASTYLAPLKDDTAVFAVRGRYGFLVGVTTNDVPANKRFYAGGGGSIRGYEFRSVGPLDSDDDPIGGRSVAEISMELRLRFLESFGIVPFLDGGQVYDDAYPSLGEDFQWGAGLGLRYFTAIGPVRFDFAVPLNPRDDDVDDDYQFYISIGQAF